MGNLRDEILEMFAGAFEVTVDEVKELIICDWCAREAAELEIFGERRTSEVKPFLEEVDGRVLADHLDEVTDMLNRDYLVELKAMKRLEGIEGRVKKAIEEQNQKLFKSYSDMVDGYKKTTDLLIKKLNNDE
jgi:hypothetical protein